MSQLFIKRIKQATDMSPISRTLGEVEKLINEQKSEMRSVGEFIGLESLSEAQANELATAVENWSASFQRIAQSLAMEHVQPSQIEGAAAIMAGLSDVKGFLRSKVVTTGVGNENTTFVGVEGMADGTSERLPAQEATAITHFINAICEMAKTQKRIAPTSKPVENEKYAFRCFLLRLGFIGDEFKADRKVLLQNLSGSTAFKGGAK